MPIDVETVLESYPQDQIDADNLAQFRGFLEEQLLVNRCDDCGTWHQPPNAICPACWSRRVTATQVTGRGSIHLLMRVHQGPGIEPGQPLPVVTVELAEQEGLRFTAALVEHDEEQLTIGQPVELTWIDQHGSPWPVFRPVAE